MEEEEEEDDEEVSRIHLSSSMGMVCVLWRKQCRSILVLDSNPAPVVTSI